jgi:hypothetical protein
MARELLAYLLLRDALTAIPTTDLPSGTAELTETCKEAVVGHVDFEKCTPLTLTAPWDPNLKIQFKLRSLPGFSADIGAYSVIADKSFVPVSAYSIGRFHAAVTPIHDVSFTPRHIADAVAGGDELPRSPRLWNRTRIVLNLLSTSAPAQDFKVPNDVKLGDPVVKRFITDYLSIDGTKETLAGLPIPVLMLPFGMAALIVISCCILVGTWAAFRGVRFQSIHEESGWVMLEARKGAEGATVAVASYVLASATLAVPAIALAQTVRLGLGSPSFVDSMGLWMLTVTLGVLLLAMAGNVFELLRLRWATAGDVQ